jgi:predicted ATP-grasp superfamily ATP-dependent carboligase
VVQEWIEGRDSDIYFCLQYLDGQGQAVVSFTGRKIRSWPPQVGGTASCTAAPEAHAELSALTANFFRDAGVVGMAGMEYKRDSRTREFRMVEPTIGRTDYQEEVATLNGVNLPHAAWCCELGLPFPDTAAIRRPIAWRVRSEDVQSAALQGESPRDGYPHGARIADALFRWTDPAPFLVQNGRRVHNALQTRLARTMHGPEAARSKS